MIFIVNKQLPYTYCKSIVRSGNTKMCACINKHTSKTSVEFYVYLYSIFRTKISDLITQLLLVSNLHPYLLFTSL